MRSTVGVVAAATFREAVASSNERAIAMNDFDRIMEWLKPSVTSADLEKFDKFRRQR